VEKEVRKKVRTGEFVGVSGQQEGGQDVVEETPLHSFRVVGGADAAQVQVTRAKARAVEAVSVASFGRDRFLVTPIRDVPVEGSSIDENGYNVNMAQARVVSFLGGDVYISRAVWSKAFTIVKGGGKVVFVRGKTRVKIKDKQLFPVVIRGG